MWYTGGLRIGRVGGIFVEVHPAFVLVLAWSAWQGWAQYGSAAGAGYSILAICLLFACVMLHELGHGLQARVLGLSARSITLLPLGGLLQLETSPSQPWHELVIALAGPLVNLGLALILWAVVVLIQPFTLHRWSDYLLFRATPGLNTLLIYLLWANLFLFFFNMLPALPMDGGQVIRAALAIWSDYEIATRIAAWLGRIVAVGIAVAGAVGWPPGYGSNPALVVVGLVIYLGAHHEELYVRRRRALVHVEAGNVCHPPRAVVAPWDPLSPALTRALKSGRILPVMVGQRVVGLLTAHDLHKPAARAGGATVAHVMQSDFPVLHPHDTLWVALKEMLASQLAVLPVVLDDTLCGLVDLDDIKNAWRFPAHHRRRAEATPISGETIQ